MCTPSLSFQGRETASDYFRPPDSQCPPFPSGLNMRNVIFPRDTRPRYSVGGFSGSTDDPHKHRSLCRLSSQLPYRLLWIQAPEGSQQPLSGCPVFRAKKTHTEDLLVSHQLSALQPAVSPARCSSPQSPPLLLTGLRVDKSSGFWGEMQTSGAGAGFCGSTRPIGVE